MARARVYLRGSTWYLDYTHPTQGRTRVPTDAKTKGAAKTLLNEILSGFSRQKLGLDAAPVETSTTLWQLCQWWLKDRCSKVSREIEEGRLTKHVKNGVVYDNTPQRLELGTLPLHLATPEVFDAYFTKIAQPTKLEDGTVKPGARPGAVNKLRSILRAIFNAARKPATPSSVKWMGRNPLEDTEPKRVIKRKYATLVFEEVDPMLAKVPEHWLGFFATGIYTGLRKGEICGLLKRSVDLRMKEIDVRNSYTNDTTKGKHEDTLPIVPALLPYIVKAMESNPGSEWLFPALDGKSMRSEDSNPEKILRTALKRAGMIDGYRHHCRRCGHARRERGAPKDSPKVPSKYPRYSVVHADADLRECPQCEMKLWAEAVPRGGGTGRGMRFHDLRHSLATILLRSGADIHSVQRILRHANIETTTSTYAHLQTEDLRGVLNIFGGKSGGAQEGHTCPTCKGTGKIQGTNRAQG